LILSKFNSHRERDLSQKTRDSLPSFRGFDDLLKLVEHGHCSLDFVLRGSWSTHSRLLGGEVGDLAFSRCEVGLFLFKLRSDCFQDRGRLGQGQVRLDN